MKYIRKTTSVQEGKEAARAPAQAPKENVCYMDEWNVSSLGQKGK